MPKTVMVVSGANGLKMAIEGIEQQILYHMVRCGTLASNELRNNSLQVLRGQRHGRTYRVPGTGRVHYDKKNKTATISYRTYTASAPGEAPAVRTGVFRTSWMPKTEVYGNGHQVVSMIESNIRVGRNQQYKLGDLLDEGTKRMAPRPYKKEIAEKSLPKIMRYYGDLRIAQAEVIRNGRG